MPSKSDTIPAMLTPGEVVLNEKQQKALEKYVGQSREEIFGKIKVPGFNIGGKVKYKKYYKEGGKVKNQRAKSGTAAHQEEVYQFEQSQRDQAKAKARMRKQQKAWIAWAEKQKKLSTIEKKTLQRYKMEISQDKTPPGLKGGGKVKKAYSRMYKAKWGG